MGDGGPLDRAVPAEGEARLAVDVLRVSCIRTIITVVDGDLDLHSFRMGLPRIRRGIKKITPNRQKQHFKDTDRGIQISATFNPVV